MTWAVAVISILAVVLGLWCVWTATRLDRMHLLLDSSAAALSEALVRRSAAATDVALSSSHDPASALALLDSAGAAREAPKGDWQAQSDLSRVIRMLDESQTRGDDAQLLHRACRDVSLARRIHNDLAVRAQGLHQRRRVRWFRLAGHAPWPRTIEFDDLDDMS